MKRTALLWSLAWAAACSFPDYKPAADGSSAGTGGTSTDPDPCHDGKRNGEETGIDCGMLACSVTCPAGQGCDGNADCDGGICEDRICQAANCEDQLENGAESDVDCGGGEGCRRCTADERCSTLTDCDGGDCVNGTCRAISCKDGLPNGHETDVDCGGTECAPCAEGQGCGLTEDCDNVTCVKGKCQPRGCSDGLVNQDETDLDCGGSCPSACIAGSRCKEGTDCDSGVCPKPTLLCAVPACDDGVKNGDEPSVDCGGSCSKKCAVLDSCAAAGDCETSSCLSDVCVPTSPTNEVLSMLGWVASASHELKPNATADMAIDGSLSTDWITGAEQAAEMWFAVDMQERHVIFSVELVIDNSSDFSDAPVSVDVWFSDDGVFTTRTIKNRSGSPQLRIDFDQPQVARYIKISLSPGVSKNKWWRIDELRVRQ